MAYRFRRRDKSVAYGVRRIAREQIDQAIDAIDNPDDIESTVHDIRKRCKKLRGLVRLVRPEFPAYKEENAAFRDTAGLLSGLRDARVLQLTYDDLVKRYEKHVDRRRMGRIRKRLTDERKEALDRTDVAACLRNCRSALADARERVRDWQLEADEWDALSSGLMKTYRRAQDAADQARESNSPEDFHALRKRIKYHWFHIRLLRDMWREHMQTRARLAKDISDLLGQHHDLTVFEREIPLQPTSSDGEVDVEIALVLARRQRVILEERTWPLVERLLAQSPEALADHWGGLWESWRC